MQLLSGLMAQIFRVVQERKSLMKFVNNALESCGILPRVKGEEKSATSQAVKTTQGASLSTSQLLRKSARMISTGAFSLSRAQSSYYISVFSLKWADTSRDPLHGNSALVFRWKSFPGHGRGQSTHESLKGRHVVRKCPISGTEGCCLG